MSSRINARIDDDLARQLEDVARATGNSASAIIKLALEAYIESHKARMEVQPRRALERAGLIGCAHGEPELSQSYKPLLAASLGKKA